MKKIDFKISTFCAICLFVIKINAQVVSTYAGAVSGSTDGSISLATFSYPHGIYINSTGDIYIADQDNNKIRKISSAGVVSTFAGSGVMGSANGTGTGATFNKPRGICADASGNLYIADSFNHKIRKITPTGVVTNFAGSGITGSTDATGTAASFFGPRGICIDANGNLYVADEGNHKIRKITPAGVVTTFAGTGTSGAVDGPGATASFNVPQGICIDGSGDFYVADSNNNLIRKISSTGVVSTLAGSGTSGFVDGTGVAASFNKPISVYANSSGDVLVCDRLSHSIRKVTSTGVVTTIAGSGAIGSTNGTGTAASFNNPSGLYLNASGDIFVADLGNHKIRKIAVCVAPLAPTNTTPTSSQTLCENNSTILSATSTGTVNWYATPTGTTVLASGTSYTTSVLSAGTYTYYAEASTCSVSATRAAITVNVNATPIISVNSGSICSGSSFTINPTGASSYTISGGATVVTPTINTSYNVTGTSVQGCVSSNAVVSSVTVNAKPTVSVNSGSICSGSSFTINPTGANTYTISGGSAIVTPTTNTSYNVTGTSAQGCLSSNTAVSSITVNAIPVVSVNSGSICSGNSFTINPTGANTYTISGGSAIVSPTTNTSYNVTGTSAQGCVSSNTAVSSVTVNAIPNVTAITNNTLLCTGQTASLTAIGASTYLWNTSATTSVIAVTPTISTNYTVTGTDVNGCSKSVVLTQSVSACTGILVTEVLEAEIKIYPNPSNGIFTISGIEQNTSIYIYNAIGELVKSILSTDNKTTFDLSDYSNGVYFIKIKNDKGEAFKKLIKQ